MQKILFLFFCILFFPFSAFSAWPGDCTQMFYRVMQPFQQGTVWTYTVSYNSSSPSFITAMDVYQNQQFATVQYIVAYWDPTSNYGQGAWSLGASKGVVVSLATHSAFMASYNPIELTSEFTSPLAYQVMGGGCPSSCDTADSDNDGVCNECDQAPGQPDLDDCLLTESVDKNTGQLVGVVINRQCDGQTHEFWQSDNYNPVTARSWANIGSSADKLGKQNCQAGLPAGQCCAYSAGSPGETYTASLSPQSAVPATHQQFLDSLLDLPSVDDIPEKCANHNATCKEYCEDKLGVALSYCREDSEGKKVSKCQCSNDFAYEMASPQESTQEKIDQVNNAVNQDSNSNGVPDYADANTQGKTDTDSDGIHDQADVDHTGGMDTNGDGIDDQVTAQAHANAVASSGLSQADSANLDAIEQSTAQTASGVGAVKGSVDGLKTEVQGLRSDMAVQDQKTTEYRDKVGGALDSFTEGNTATIDESQLNSDLFTGLQSSDVPEDPTENFDVEAFVQEFSFAFPQELDTLIQGSAVNVSNSNSCIQGVVMGAPFEFCFDTFQAIFIAMGYVFKALCTFRAMEIIIAGVRL